MEQLRCSINYLDNEIQDKFRFVYIINYLFWRASLLS